MKNIANNNQIEKKTVKSDLLTDGIDNSSSGRGLENETKGGVEGVDIGVDVSNNKNITQILSPDTETIGDRTIRSINIVQGVFRSIRAAIMSRNMSHNLGSHVLSYLKIQLNNVGNIMENQLLSNLVNAQWNPDSENIFSVKGSDLELPYLVGLGHFISLLQERQDYIATIATDYIPCFTPVDFKEAIFDGLNPDYKWIRHKTEESEKGRHPRNLLLEYIARSEGLTRGDSEELGNIVFKYGYDFLYCEKKYEWKSIQGDAVGGIDFMRGKQLSLPGGMLGRQAIFSIVENIIRNAAKHEVRDKDHKDLNITLGLIDGDMVADRTTKGLSKRLLFKIKGKKHLGDYWFLSISYPATNAKGLKKSLTKKLNTPFMDKDFDIDERNRGIKEIIISAAFLRRESNLSNQNVEEIANLLVTTEINAEERGRIIAKNCKLKPSAEEPDFVYIDVDRRRRQIRYVIPVRKVLPLMVCTEGMSDDDSILFNAKTEDCPWQVCESTADFISESVKRGFEYYIVANKDIYNKVRPYCTNRIVIWNERDAEMKEYWHGEETEFHHLMRIVCAMHAHCSIHPNKEEEYIYIDDIKTEYSHPKDDKNKKDIFDKKNKMWTSHYGTISENERQELQKLFDFEPFNHDENVKYFYRTHLETSRNYEEYLANRLSGDSEYQNDFVEGISGGNSTDRLLRREPFTFESYTKHLVAAKNRVAIIDERMFKDIHGIDGSLCLGDGRKIEGEKSYRSLQFMQKGIDIFAIIPTGDGSEFALVGCVMLKNEYGEEIAGCQYCQLATLSYNKGFHLQVKRSDFVLKQYDYCAIHQGILDKLYKPFKSVKGDNIDKNAVLKLNVTRKLYNSFIKAKIILGQDSQEGFLPNFIIHSGRGKCTKADMPQKLPFVTYAQISHAINDCKYNLIQLFDFVRYES